MHQLEVTRQCGPCRITAQRFDAELHLPIIRRAALTERPEPPGECADRGCSAPAARPSNEMSIYCHAQKVFEAPGGGQFQFPIDVSPLVRASR
ncbi:MAG: hypothetical protein ACRD3W_16250 [Terriglobales bacterium]